MTDEARDKAFEKLRTLLLGKDSEQDEWCVMSVATVRIQRLEAELQRKDECIKKALNLEGKLLLIMSDWATKHQLQNALLDALKEEQ